MSGKQAILADERIEPLAFLANQHHDALCGLAKRGLAHALAAGAALNEARTKFVPSPGYPWQAWMKQHLSFDYHTANWYMRIDHFRDELPDDVTTMKGAMRFLRENGHRIRQTLDDSELARLFEMFDGGAGQTEIASELGISKQGVHHHIVNRTRTRRVVPSRRIQVDDVMIERAARWLVSHFADAGYFVRVTQQVRDDAAELLTLALTPEDGEEMAA